jgi:hypothetical protein
LANTFSKVTLRHAPNSAHEAAYGKGNLQLPTGKATAISTYDVSISLSASHLNFVQEPLDSDVRQGLLVILIKKSITETFHTTPPHCKVRSGEPNSLIVVSNNQTTELRFSFTNMLM